MKIVSKNAGIPLYIIENYVRTVKKINCKKTENNGPQGANPGYGTRDSRRFKQAQSSRPARVGSQTAAAVQRREPVSRRMVRQVVRQGQWNMQRVMRQRAVRQVQP